MNPSNNFRLITQLQQLEPARTYLWDLKFHMRPFRTDLNSWANSAYIPNKVIAWMPAESMSVVEAIVNSSDITVGQTSYRFPSGTTAKEITINFIDDYKYSIKKWIKYWMETLILCNGKCINYLEHLVDILEIQDLDAKKDSPQIVKKLYVYPDGPITPAYTSDSGIHVYSINFVVTGAV